MGASGTSPSSTVEFTASDGTSLVGDLRIPERAAAAAIVCHPHPSYGGDRFNHVVAALFDGLPTSGITTLRFDFRADFDGGRSELLDALAALDVVAGTTPGAPLVAVGYSFGALIALALDDGRLAGVVAVAPPLGAGAPLSPPTAPTLVLTPEHDQFSPPDASEPFVDEWRRAGAATVDHLTVEMADHSLVGHTATVTSTASTWLRTTIAA